MSSPMLSMPSEGEPHTCTVLGWPTARSILETEHAYKGSDVHATWLEIANLAYTIAKYEPVKVFVQDESFASSSPSATTLPYITAARDLLVDKPNITVHFTPNIDSLWLRDTGPVIVRSLHGPIDNTWDEHDDPGFGFKPTSTRSSTVALTLNFNQWGRKNRPNNDSYTADTVAQVLGLSIVRAPFTAEGGAIEVDGEGTFLGTESAILNPNRNPGIDKESMEGYLRQYLGVRKCVWLPGKRGRDVTDDHIDIVARFARPGVILISKPFVGKNQDSNEVWKDFRDIKTRLAKETDAQGRSFELIEVPEPDFTVLGDIDMTSGPSASYVNFLVANGVVFVSKFGDEAADAVAVRIIGGQFPDRKIEQQIHA